MTGKGMSKDFIWGVAMGGMLSPILIILLYSLVSRPGASSGNFPPPPVPIDTRVSLDWEVESVDGKVVNLKEAFENKVVFLNVWATWCGPCIKEMPSIDALYKEYGSRMAFVCVSNEGREVVQAFVETSDHEFPVYLMKGIPPEAFITPSIPATFIIGPGGILKMKHEGGADWGSAPVRAYLDVLLNDVPN